MAHIKVGSDVPEKATAVGSTPTSVFTFNFTYISAADIKVYRDGVLLPSSEYTLVGNAADRGFEGGEVTLNTAISNKTLLIKRATDRARATDFPTSGTFDIDGSNTEFDAFRLIAQEIDTRITRSLRFKEFDANLPSGELPTLDDIKGKYLRFNITTGEPEPVAADPLGETSADLVTYLPSDGSSETTVRAHLRRTSVKEFGGGNTTANMGIGYNAISGNKLLVRSDDPDISTDSGISTTVQFQRIARYGASATVNPKALRVYYQVNDGAEIAARPWSISGEIENYSTSNTSGEGGTAVSGVAIKHASNTGIMFGGHFQVRDETDGVTGGGIIGVELNIQANGADTNSNRIGIDLIARTWAGGTSAGDFTAGLRVRNTTGGNGTWLKGISVEDTGSTRKMPLGISIDTSPGSGGVGLQDAGNKDIGISMGSTYAEAAIKFTSAAVYQMRSTTGAVSSTADLFLEANSAVGVILNGTYTSGNAIRLRGGQAIAWENTGVIKTYYDSGSSQIRLMASASDRMAFEIDPSPRILMNGTQVLQEQISGWGAPTGTATRTAFNTASVTLSQLAERVKALIDDATTHGIIGA